MLLFLASLLTGCASDEAIGCDFRDGGVGGAEDRCQERTGIQSNNFDTFCEGLGATPVEGGCDREGVVAGCTASAPGGDITDWYYAPTTLAEVEEECEGAGEVVEP